MNELTGEKKYLDVAESVCNFILQDLNIHTFNEGLCFSYTPIDKSVVYNASSLGASLLSRVYSKRTKNIYLEASKKAFDFIISSQKSDGCWYYSRLSKFSERKQIDWHQGFILDSIKILSSIQDPKILYTLKA